jgi:hypothetical protein
MSEFVTVDYRQGFVEVVVGDVVMGIDYPAWELMGGTVAGRAYALWGFANRLKFGWYNVEYIRRVWPSGRVTGQLSVVVDGMDWRCVR